MPGIAAPAAGTGGTAPASAGGPLAEGTLNLSPTTTSPSSAPSAGSALLVSSAPARAATASNATQLQTITAPKSTTTGAVVQPSTSSVSNTSTSPVTPTSTQPNNSAPVITPAANTTGLTSDQLKAAGIADVTGWSQTTNAGGQTIFTPPTTPTSTSNGTGGQSSTSTTTTDPYAAAVANISDPAVAQQYSAVLKSLDDSAAQAQATITSLQNATAGTDPATQAAITSITSKYQQQIQLMQAKNNQMIGQANTSVAAFGGLGSMSQTFLNNQQQDANDRITTLQDQEQSLIMQAQAAFQTGNAKALNDAMTEYNDINSKKLDALNDLLTSSSKQVTSLQDQQKIDLQAQKDQVSNDIATSTKIAAGVAANIKAAGLTDPTDIQAYIQGIATQYGITNPDLLYSQVVTAGQTADKVSASLANTQDSITNRDANTNARLSVDQQNNQDNAQKAGIAYQTYLAKVSAGTLGGKTTVPSYKFSPTATASLYSAGETNASITKLSQDIAQYGPQYVIQNGQGLTPGTTQVIKTEFGI